MNISQQVYDAIERYMVEEETAIKVSLRHDDGHTAQFVDEVNNVTHDVIFYMSSQNDYIEYEFG